jgi:hypothetical protein
MILEKRRVAQGGGGECGGIQPVLAVGRQTVEEKEVLNEKGELQGDCLLGQIDRSVAYRDRMSAGRCRRSMRQCGGKEQNQPGTAIAGRTLEFHERTEALMVANVRPGWGVAGRMT